jgi:hypothetical protein
MLSEHFHRKLDHIFSQMRSFKRYSSPLPSNIIFNMGFNEIHKILTTQLTIIKKYLIGTNAKFLETTESQLKSPAITKLI